MAISDANKTKLNKSNRAMQNASGGTVLQKADRLLGQIEAPFQTGSLTVTTAQIDASAIVIDTGQTTVAGFLVQRFMSGSQIIAMKVVNSGSYLDITAGAGSPLAEGDAIYWITI